MKRAAILSPWAQVLDPENGPMNVPLAQILWADAGHGWTNMHDVTGQPTENIEPDPNLATWEVDGISDAALDVLDADGRCAIVWEVTV